MFKLFTDADENKKEDSMFKKQTAEVHEQDPVRESQVEEKPEKKPVQVNEGQQTNRIVKGSKLTGNIIIAYDLELNGDVEGNITSEQKSNIVIKGNCKGNIKTKEGNVDLIGCMDKGDITAGGNITITGRFKGGRAEANGKLFIDGEFSGTLAGKEIEVGPRAIGKGELYYSEFISIARGASVEAQISKSQGNTKTVPQADEAKVVKIDRPVQEVKEVKKGAADPAPTKV
jgi:cytoskeletal protein CcmA (bactofilin family)